MQKLNILVYETTKILRWQNIGLYYLYALYFCPLTSNMDLNKYVIEWQGKKEYRFKYRQVK